MAKSNSNKENHIASKTDVTLHSKGNLTHMLSANSVPEKPAMRGFDPKFADLVDYIVRITHEIWEEKAIAEAINNNHFKGIATDVLAEELNNIKNSELWKAQKEANK